MLGKHFITGGLGLALLGLAAGCGAVPVGPSAHHPPTPSHTSSTSSGTSVSSAGSTAAPATTVPTASTHRLTAGPFAITVPANWTVGNQIKLSKLMTSGTNAAFLLPNTVEPSDQGIANRGNLSPFFSEQLTGSVAGSASLAVNELVGDGMYYELMISVPGAEKGELVAAAKTLTTPAPATATQDVRLIQALPQPPHGDLYYTTDRLGDDQWLLVGGNPATAQETFALFRSTDGGGHWTLTNHTLFQGESHFLQTEGLPSIRFWNADAGIIAESSGFAQTILIAYTSDGGMQWKSAHVPKVGQPTGQSAPVITRNANGILDVTTHVFADKVVTVQSTNNGKTWTMVPLPTS